MGYILKNSVAKYTYVQVHRYNKSKCIYYDPRPTTTTSQYIHLLYCIYVGSLLVCSAGWCVFLINDYAVMH